MKRSTQLKPGKRAASPVDVAKVRRHLSGGIGAKSGKTLTKVELEAVFDSDKAILAQACRMAGEDVLLKYNGVMAGAISPRKRSKPV
ncbi:hypothetical protein [Stenotrophomonas bentonitica]|uniref:Uncharacterized protein n=1 Tax=Stenotrophomonas bentonitica TaxID=1450134 RepID=A0ABU9JK00_9GAMM|nr:hypothetical protein [Stenotrophomonas bentonitica]